MPDDQSQTPSGSTRSRGVGAIALGSLFAIAIATTLTLSIRDKFSANQTRETQIALSRVEIRIQEVRALEWLAIAAREITPESESRLEVAKHELASTNKLMRLRNQDKLVEQLDPAITNFTRVVDRQLQLIRSGNFADAQQADFGEVSPQFDALQHQIREASDSANRLAQTAATRCQIEGGISALLTAILVVFLFLRVQRQRQLALAKQAVLEQSEKRFRALTEKSSDIVCITDAAGVVNYVTPSLETVLALGADVLCGQNLSYRVHPDDVPKLRSAMGIGEGESAPFELRLRHSDKRWLYFECVVRNLLKFENINGLVLNAREITERKKAEEQLLFTASHDQLTGLPNRVVFLNRLQTVIDRIRRHGQQMAAVLFVDVDDFKVINDCLGHATGDELIVEVGNRLKACMRSDGTVARMGGDEFTVLLEDITDPSDAIRVAERIHSTAAKPFFLNGQEVSKGVSIGIALTSKDTSAQKLVQNADIAMYRAKSKGKGRSELFDAAMHEQVMGQLQLEGRLRRALQNNELKLHYQPIVAIGTGLIEGFEALLRWQPAGSASVSPGVFIPLAEQSGLIVPISSWVLTAGCLEAVSWRRKCPDAQPLYVSLNVSARYFSHPAFIGHVREALEKSTISPERVKIELTESVAMNDAPSTENTMSQLRALGIKLSIDDFGTGYSSLSYLQRFPVDTLKIDQSFISAMQTERENSAIVSTIIALGQNLGLQVVAEGVETLSQLEMLRSIGCDAAQGYFFSKPVPADVVKTLVDLNQTQAEHAGA
jgi:diguanylate cyclase (GGDEF)-like protein/PAS domain S-box-containing protein